MVNDLPLTQSDVKGDIYEYLLSKLTTAGINGQFRTPRHIIDAMIELIAPQPTDVICDPSCGNCLISPAPWNTSTACVFQPRGHLHRRRRQPALLRDLLSNPTASNSQMFWGFDFDTTMLRVSSMNMMLHGVSGANIRYQDSLSKSIKEYYPSRETSSTWCWPTHRSKAAWTKPTPTPTCSVW